MLLAGTGGVAGSDAIDAERGEGASWPEAEFDRNPGVVRADEEGRGIPACFPEGEVQADDNNEMAGTQPLPRLPERDAQVEKIAQERDRFMIY